MKQCCVVDCTRPVFGKGYCKYHQQLRTDKKPKAPNKRSKKLQEVYSEKYIPEMRAFLQRNDECQMKTPVCTYHATAVHHLRGRISKRLIDTEEWLATCAACNGWVEDHHEEAVKMGLKLPRNGKD